MAKKDYSQLGAGGGIESGKKTRQLAGQAYGVAGGAGAGMGKTESEIQQVGEAQRGRTFGDVQAVIGEMNRGAMGSGPGFQKQKYAAIQDMTKAGVDAPLQAIGQQRNLSAQIEQAKAARALDYVTAQNERRRKNIAQGLEVAKYVTDKATEPTGVAG